MNTQSLSNRDAGSPGYFMLSFSLSLLLCLAAALVSALGLNRELFLQINSLHGLTGGVFWANVTILGDTLVAAVLLLPLVRYRPAAVWAGICTLLVGGSAVQFIKAFAAVKRPLWEIPETAMYHIGPHLHSLSFPSGHTATAFALAGIFIWAFPRWWQRLPVLALAALVGVSRIAVGVHWPLDVLAGAAIGLLSAWVGVRLAQKWPRGGGLLTMKIAGGVLLAGAGICAFVNFTSYAEGMPLQRFVGAAMIVFGGRQFAGLWGNTNTNAEENAEENANTEENAGRG